MRVLIVDDHSEITDVLRTNLEDAFFAVDVANEGEKGLYMARTNPYDLILLDYVMPKVDGRQICTELRKDGKTTPIMMMSVKSEVPDKVELLNIGADDYVTKPFSQDELVARMRALLRRPVAIQKEVLRYADLEMDIAKHLVTRAGKPIPLTRKEFMLLECLMRNAGDVVPRSALVDQVWDSGLDSFSNTVETHVLNLRKKIEMPDKKKLIHTVPGAGYRLGS